MRLTTKKIVIVSSATLATAGLVAYAYNKFLHSADHERKVLAKFVAEHTGNNLKLQKAISKLSDDQVEHLLKMIDKLSVMKDKIYIEGNNIQEMTKKIINQVAEHLGTN